MFEVVSDLGFGDGAFLVLGVVSGSTHAVQMCEVVVANGGEGLHILSSDGARDLRPPASTRFVFVRPQAVATR